MIERPILFSCEMVRAILEGRKTQTRRVLSIQPLDVLPMNVPDQWTGLMQRDPNHGNVFGCRYGKVCDRLWVRETFAINDVRYESPIPKERPEDLEEIIYRADGEMHEQFEVVDGDLNWRPSIHMPRWASRLTLEIVNVRCERLQEISEADAKAEGIEFHGVLPSAPDRFAALWDSINANRGYGWEKNPWVWVIEFKKL